MRLLSLAFIVASLTILVASCHEGSILNPKTGPGTSYPCGVHGVECSNHKCCDDHEVCGYTGAWSTCPEGSCCYTGDNWPRASLSPEAGTDAGVTAMTRVVHKQRDQH